MSRDDNLMHYGVKGMKWGVRKDKVSSGGKGSVVKTAFKVTHPLTYAAGKKFNEYRKTDSYKSKKNKIQNLTGSRSSDARKKYRNKNINSMSNQELQEAINRMNLERNYRSLTKVDFMAGQKTTSDILKYNTTMKTVKKTLGV